MKPRFAPGLRILARLFHNVATAVTIEMHWALIGGLAVSAWGPARATQDIDVLADSDPGPIHNHALRIELQEYWEAQGCAVEWRVGMADDPIPLLLRLRLPRPAGLSADVLWAHKRWQQEALPRACAVRVARFQVLVLHPEDLILLKLEAGGPQDLLDVEGILSANPPELNRRRLREAATRLRLKALLDRCVRRVEHA